MSYPLILNVIPINKRTSYMPEYISRLYLISFPDQQMNMIPHQAICIKLISACFLIPFQQTDKELIIFFVIKDLLLIDSSQHDVVDLLTALFPGSTRHLLSFFPCRYAVSSCALSYQAYLPASIKRRQRTVPCLRSPVSAAFLH